MKYEKLQIAKKHTAEKKSELCVISPTYNQYNLIKKLILLLKKQSIKPDIIIVDQNSNDNTYELLRSKFKDITIIKTKKNYGCAGGMYIGQKYAYEKGYKYMILNDNDAYPIDKNIIEHLIKNCDENTVVQPFNVSEEEKNSKTIYVFHMACYHRKTIEKIGFVNYKLFLYGEDTEYLIRLRRNKINIKKIPSRYSHPMKTYQTPNATYFYIRNALHNMTIKYSFKDIIYTASYIAYYKLKKKRNNICLKAISDFQNDNWNNEVNFNNDEIIEKMKNKNFLREKNIMVNLDKKTRSILKIKNSNFLSLLNIPTNFIFKKTLISNGRTLSPLFPKSIIIIDCNKKYSKIIIEKSEILASLRYIIIIFLWCLKIYYILYNHKNNKKYLNQNMLSLD